MDSVTALYALLISIHAPSRERREINGVKVYPSPFQSTLPRGSDLYGRTSLFPKLNFNPRSLAGATRVPPARRTIRDSISIHAPSRERQNSAVLFGHHLKFQSTLPRGSDAPRFNEKRKVKHFNPRSLAGATGNGFDFARLLIISIHAPSRERQRTLASSYVNVIFQSTLPRGSD